MKELPFSILGEAIQRVVKLSFSSSVVVGVKGINISQYYYELGFLLWGGKQSSPAGTWRGI